MNVTFLIEVLDLLMVDLKTNKKSKLSGTKC